MRLKVSGKKEPYLRHRGKVELTLATKPANAQQRKKSSSSEIFIIMLYINGLVNFQGGNLSVM